MRAFGQSVAYAFPVTDPGERRKLIAADRCPECGEELDTGRECLNWECRFHDEPHPAA